MEAYPLCFLYRLTQLLYSKMHIWLRSLRGLKTCRIDCVRVVAHLLKEDVKSFARFSTSQCELFRHNLENPSSSRFPLKLLKICVHLTKKIVRYFVVQILINTKDPFHLQGDLILIIFNGLSFSNLGIKSVILARVTVKIPFNFCTVELYFQIR